MAGSGAGDGDGMITEINVTPLVDIMLVLLIVFMATASLIEKQGIELDLPRAATGEQVPATPLMLALSRGGVLQLNGETVSLTALRARLPDLVRRDPQLQAIVAADRSVAHGEVVRLIDVVRQAGIYRFALSTDPEPAAALPAAAPP